MKRLLRLLLFCPLLLLALPRPAMPQTPTPSLYSWFPFPSYVGSTGNMSRPTNAQCLCFLAALTTANGMPALDTMELNVTTLDADDVLKFGIYSENGQTRFFSCTFPVTATGAKTCANAESLVTVPEGNYWFCFAESTVNTEDWQIARANGDTPYRIASETFTCASGNLPSTYTPAARSVGTGTSTPYLWVTDD